MFGKIKKLNKAYKLENVCVDFYFDSDSGCPTPYLVVAGNKQFRVLPVGHRHRFKKDGRPFHVLTVASEEMQYFRLTFDVCDLAWNVELIGGPLL